MQTTRKTVRYILMTNKKGFNNNVSWMIEIDVNASVKLSVVAAYVDFFKYSYIELFLL